MGWSQLNYILRNADGSSAVLKFLSLGVTYALYTLDGLEEKTTEVSRKLCTKIVTKLGARGQNSLLKQSQSSPSGIYERQGCKPSKHIVWTSHEVNYSNCMIFFLSPFIFEGGKVSCMPGLSLTLTCYMKPAADHWLIHAQNQDQRLHSFPFLRCAPLPVLHTLPRPRSPWPSHSPWPDSLLLLLVLVLYIKIFQILKYLLWSSMQVDVLPISAS